MALTMPALHRLRCPLAALLGLLVALPVLGVAALALRPLFDGAAWSALLQHPLTPQALLLSAWTGLLSTVLAWWISAALLAHGFVSRRLDALLRGLPVMLATPHAAFAIGLVFLLAPSGWLLRALSPWLTGFEFPPPWPTTQDPWGLGLVLVLVAKEVPFLLWTAATQLQRDDLRQRWRAEHALAQTLGYSASRAWWRVVWPQLGKRLSWPLLAVLVYGLTVVDMALVVGPAAPPTLAVLAWQWLLDADPASNAQGAAAGGALALLVALAWLAWQGGQALGTNNGRLLDGERGAITPTGLHPAASAARALALGAPLLVCLYGAVLLALAVGSVAGIWPFPSLWPQVFTLQAWQSVWGSSATIGDTLLLALGSTALALVWSVAWLELAPGHWDRALRPLLYLPLAWPAVLWVVGLYGGALALRLEGHWGGLLLAHTLMVLPYLLLALSPAYLGFDRRYAALCASLGRGTAAYLWCVKWPLLRRSLAASAAVGFAVSVAQYLPTLYVGAGRFNTVTTEAVTLAAGAQRSLTSAYAALQWLLPLLAFAAAAWLGQPRRFQGLRA